MAPSTPPPPSSVRFAALTIASSASVVISATQTISRVEPTSAVRSGVASGIGVSVSRPLGLRLGAQIHRTLDADIVEMLVEKATGGALAAEPQHFKKIIIGRKLAEGVEMRAETVEHDAMNIDAAILAGADTARQPALIDQAGDEFDGAVLGDERGVESDLVDAVHDLTGRGRRC